MEFGRGVNLSSSVRFDETWHKRRYVAVSVLTPGCVGCLLLVQYICVMLKWQRNCDMYILNPAELLTNGCGNLCRNYYLAHRRNCLILYNMLLLIISLIFIHYIICKVSKFLCHYFFICRYISIYLKCIMYQFVNENAVLYLCESNSSNTGYHSDTITT